jgi:hypothetical protein
VGLRPTLDHDSQRDRCLLRRIFQKGAGADVVDVATGQVLRHVGQRSDRGISVPARDHGVLLGLTEPPVVEGEQQEPSNYNVELTDLESSQPVAWRQDQAQIVAIGAVDIVLREQQVGGAALAGRDLKEWGG